ncbi:P-loop containing nucleoside triphosphate hydrolase protein [Cantharellus anzutake]|uniref:P-loop containing nucleoside triphosphate hydrolase protein n=1 Tax=Cantharellus anzutake TaxID=1750568 RepID=UPI001906BC3D|nr:P-loop containing nucleoside triphosphate hydrolase protein [Cantharellus anzutake]KAF8335745.1 P-loop containing nucleoside triphosphate hydrolase protein [Cantharellus anzutake]
MAAPDEAPNTIKALCSCPTLGRGLNARSMDTQRRTVVVVENVCKLVRDPVGVEKIAASASFPEVRTFASSALKTLLGAGASKTAQPPPDRDIAEEVLSVVRTMTLDLPQNLFTPSPNDSQLPPIPSHPLFNQSLRFSARLVAELVHNKDFMDPSPWKQAIDVYLQPWVSGNGAEAELVSESIRKRFWDAEKATRPAPNDDGSENLLCNMVFSLAYGALLLLSHTTLRLVRGRRYGICAGNGSGKTTLMRAIRDGKVENFPSQDEHSLQGEDASLSIIDFIAADPALANIERSVIAKQLEEVGFSTERQTQTVGSLSGGWKMKLDVPSVKWLEDYLTSHVNVTCLIVSHDSGFLDNVTTDIIHYENKKLVYYPGNLSNFVKHVPSAKSYYTLAATSVKFSFPPPGSLMGVRSNTRAIMKMANCTFTYPGRKDPSLIDVSCALSLSSRVGIVGPNGAGKSTLIKLLTGETGPQSGTVYRHPSLRVGYVSQHATHHIEKHLEKTPVAYVQWRFQDGHDRELLEKSTRVLTEEERASLEQDFVGRNGEKRKIEMIMGRQKLKKSFQYEIKWRDLDHKFNTWLPREDLLEKGFAKVVAQFDDIEASREGAASRETSASAVRATLEQVGLDGNIAMYNEMGGLSGGQKVKVVIAAALWNNPQPTNFLDREALGGLAVAIRDWAGAVLIISHNMEFVNALCPEIWNVEAGRLARKGKVAVVEDAFADGKSRPGSTRTSAAPTPIASVSGTPAGTGDERAGSGTANPTPAIKKKKLTRNQLKVRDERRRARKLEWLSFGGPKPEDTDSD